MAKNMRFGRLTVDHLHFVFGNHVYAQCRCECGEVKSFRLTKLVEGRHKRCGKGCAA